MIFAQCAAGPVGIVLKLSTRRTIGRRLAWMDKRREERVAVVDADVVACMHIRYVYIRFLSLSLSRRAPPPLPLFSNVSRVCRRDCGVYGHAAFERKRIKKCFISTSLSVPLFLSLPTVLMNLYRDTERYALHT